MKELTNYEWVIKACKVLKTTHKFYSDFLRAVDIFGKRREELLAESINTKPKLNHLTEAIKFLDEYKNYYIKIHSPSWKKLHNVRQIKGRRIPR